MISTFPPSGDKPFYVGGISDRILDFKGKIRYLEFFEADEPFRGWPVDWYSLKDGRFKVFSSLNGFHIIGNSVTDSNGKKEWFLRWKFEYPESDYQLNVENVLSPHSKAELDYIYDLLWDNSAKDRRIVRYYRDKAVFETFRSFKP